MFLKELLKDYYLKNYTEYFEI